MKILLFIPAYNCEKQIMRVLDKAIKYERYFDTIMVVNNISTDQTAKVVKAYIKEYGGNKIVLHTNQQNYGLGGSHKVAFNQAIQEGYDYVVVLHGDDQGNIGDLIPILENKTYQQYDCCLGSRFMKGASRPGYSKFRTFGNRVYNFIFSVVTGIRIRDLGSGLNLYAVKMLKPGYYMQFPDNLSFNYAMVLALRAYKQKAMFFPIEWSEEDQVSNVKLFKQAFFVLGMSLKFLFQGKRYLETDLREKKFEAYV